MNVRLLMTNYIAHPYWPSRNLCIEIEKKSGVNRQKSDETRLAALKAECEKQGITHDDYLRLKIEASCQWYTNADGNIIIPRHQLAGAFVQAIGQAPKALRGPFDKENFRALVQVGDFVTDKTECNGVFARFVKLEGSNQRSWQENEFLGQYLEAGEPFSASGVIVATEPKWSDTVKALLRAAIETIGVGAARKMGFGRGTVVAID